MPVKAQGVISEGKKNTNILARGQENLGCHGENIPGKDKVKCLLRTTMPEVLLVQHNTVESILHKAQPSPAQPSQSFTHMTQIHACSLITPCALFTEGQEGIIYPRADMDMGCLLLHCKGGVKGGGVLPRP